MTKALLIAIIALLLIVGFMAIRTEVMSKKIDKLENKINIQVNNYGKGKEILYTAIKDPRIDTLMKLAKIKPKNVQSVTEVHYHKTEVIKNDSIVSVTDSNVCVDYEYKGFSLHGCNGMYTDERTFGATGILHRKPTKKFLFIHYHKVPVLQSWTEWGDTLNINLIERK